MKKSAAKPEGTPSSKYGKLRHPTTRTDKGRDIYNKLFDVSPTPTLVFKNKGADIILIDYNIAARSAFSNITHKTLEKSVRIVFSDFPEIRNHILSYFSDHTGAGRYATNPSGSKILYDYIKFKFTFVEPDMLLVHTEDTYNDYKLLETALRENKERLELAINASGAGLWDWNIPTGEVVYGEKWAGILGFGSGEIEGHISAWEKLLHPDDKAETMAEIEAHLQGETPNYRAEHRLLNKNGGWVWVLDMGKVVERDSQGRPIRMTGTKIDITRRKRLEKDLERFNLKLEKMVEQRTRQLRQKEKLLLKKTRELKNKSTHLEEANAALKLLLRKSDENRKEIEENMVANIKELVNPYLEKIELTRLNDTQRTSLEIIKSNLDEIVSPFSRKLTSKYMNLTPAEINVANLIRHGKSSKEIANLMCLSVKTIETQRKSIRKKLGIRRKDINLRTYLHALN